MYLLTVIPISRGILLQNLTYFSGKDIPIGSLVEIPIRRKVVKALVIEKQNIADVKSQIRSANFKIKKIKSLKAENFLPKEYIECILDTASYYASNTGYILSNTFPKTILENIDKIPKFSVQDAPQKDKHEKLVIQADEEERFSTYKSLIREEFAKNSSVLFIVPNKNDIKSAREFLEKGIENYTYDIHNEYKKNALVNIWTQIINEKHPILVIATPQFLYLPRDDFKIIIIEKENSSSYRQFIKPYIDYRTFSEILTKKRGVRLLYGDILLRTETVWRTKNLEFTDLTPIQFRAISDIKQKLSLLKKTALDKEFSPLSNELIELISKSQKNGQKTLIFGVRKGLALVLQCNDCGQSVLCQNCSSTMVLHDENGKFILCHKCNLKLKVSTKCENCGGWRLQALGIGLTLIEEKLKKKFPTAQIFSLNKDIAKTNNQIQKIINKFLESNSGILIASELALFHLQTKVDNCVCASIDSLLSIPDFRANEKILTLLFRLQNIAKNNFLIQTKHDDLKIWQYFLEGNLIDFYREEIKSRKQLNYPPFSTLIKITIQGREAAVTKEAEKLELIFKEEKPEIYPSFISKIKNKHIVNVLLKIPHGSWPSENILKILRTLSPKFTIKIDPENIL